MAGRQKPRGQPCHLASCSGISRRHARVEFRPVAPGVPAHRLRTGIREFGKHIVHVHAKDTRIDGDKLYDVGSLGLGWHTPKLPGLGDVNWGRFFSALTDTGYNGPVCIEVEDRAYEGSLADRKRSLRQSRRFLEQFIG